LCVFKIGLVINLIQIRFSALNLFNIKILGKQKTLKELFIKTFANSIKYKGSNLIKDASNDSYNSDNSNNSDNSDDTNDTNDTNSANNTNNINDSNNSNNSNNYNNSNDMFVKSVAVSRPPLKEHTLKPLSYYIINGVFGFSKLYKG
jgi:hypothetical protein